MGSILWLASYPKSGNTWLRVFLKSVLEPNSPLELNKLAEAFPYDIAAHYYRRLDPRPVTEYTRSEVLAMRPLVHRMIADENSHITFVKTHSARVIEDGHALLTPSLTVGAIYIVRNPLDVVISFSHHSGKSIDQTIDMMNLSTAVDSASELRVSEHFGSWSENVESWTRRPEKSIHVVRFEDMCEAPTKTFRSICSFLGLDARPAHIERALKRSSFRVLREYERRHGFNERPASSGAFFREGRAGQWTSVLTTAQVSRLISAHEAQMTRFGYLP